MPAEGASDGRASDFASLVSVYYYLRVTIVMYMANVEPRHALHPGCRPEYVVLFICLVAVLYLGIFPGALLDVVAGVIG